MRRFLSGLMFWWTAFPCIALGKAPPDLKAPLPEAVADPDRWLAERLIEEDALGVWPQAMPRIHRNVDGKSDTAILFIHGFGACRAEGEHIVDQIADEWKANVLYMRLPGHGRDADAHAAALPQDYTRTVSEALNVTESLGDKVVVMGASTGGLLATWAAASYPKRVDAAILVSPLFDYSAGWVSVVAGNRLPYGMARLVMGRDRYAGWSEEADSPALPGYEDHWLIEQRLRAVVRLEGLRRGVVRQPGFPAAVTSPVLLLHYYADETRKDDVVSTDAIVSTFDEMNGGRPHQHSRRVPIADGDHVLTSVHIRADHETVLTSIRVFLTDVVGPPAQ